MRSLTLWPTTPLSRVMSPASSTTTTTQRLWNFPPGVIQRQKALVLAWRGEQWRQRRQSALYCSLRSEKNQLAVDKLITLLKKFCCHVSRCPSVMFEQGRLVSDEFNSLISNVRGNPSCDSENEQIRILLERQKEQISADFQAETLEKSFSRKYMRHLDLLQRFLLKLIGWRDLDSEVAGGAEDPQKFQLLRTERPVKSEKPSGSLTQEIEKGVLSDYESTNVRTGGPVKSCVSVSVWTFRWRQRRRRKRRRRSIKHGETSEWTTHRFVHTARRNRHSLQSVWIATCSCETSRKLPSSRTRESDRESSSSRNTSSRVKSDDSWNGQCRAIRVMRNNSRSAMLRMPSYWNQGMIHCTCGHFLIESETSEIFCQWRLDAISIPNNVIKKGRPHGARHGKTDAQKEHFAAQQRAEEMYQKEFWWNSRSFPTKNWHRKTTLTAHPFEGYERYRKKLVHLTEQIGQECSDETPIRLLNSSHNNEQSPPKIWRRTTRTNRFLINTKGGILFYLLQQNRLQMIAICCNRRDV